jgi:hypothetical protein
MDKRYSKLTYIDLVKEYKLIVDNPDILKKDIILEMAKRKDDEGIPKPQIVKMIIDDLENYASQSYVRDVLKDYTDKRFDPNRNKKKEEPEKEVVLTTGKIEKEKPIIETIQFIPPVKNTKEIEKTINSLYPENKNPVNDPITPEDKETWEKLTSMVELEQENEKLKKENRELKAENEKLKNEISLLKQPQKKIINEKELSPIERMNLYSRNRNLGKK